MENEQPKNINKILTFWGFQVFFNWILFVVLMLFCKKKSAKKSTKKFAPKRPLLFLILFIFGCQVLSYIYMPFFFQKNIFLLMIDLLIDLNFFSFFSFFFCVFENTNSSTTTTCKRNLKYAYLLKLLFFVLCLKTKRIFIQTIFIYFFLFC